ncbi:MAG: helix-turn-helix domain-containing protein [Clostridia bacterium]|nr:helix-turn-helix domain-containing protein [Clostridia bacterium]
MPVSVNFQKRVRELAAETNVVYSKLTKLIGINDHSFSLAVNYGIIPSTRILIRLADYFQTSLDYLLGKTENEAFYPSETNSDFFQRITQLCAEREVTFYQAAKECHLDETYISRWVRLRSLPTLETLELLVDYFKVSIDYLLGRTDERD